MQLHIWEDCITPTRLSSPWALPGLTALSILLPLLGVGARSLVSLWDLDVPPFLYPIVIGITFALIFVLIAVLVGLLLVFLTICGITLDAYRARMARLALPERVRAKRSWHALAMTVRLATLRVASCPEPVQDPQQSKSPGWVSRWKEAWEKAASARRRRKHDAAQERRDLSGFIARGASPFVVLLCWALIAFEQYAFFFVALPYFELSSWCQTFVVPFCAFVAFRIFYDYAHTVFLSPGHPNPFADESCAEVQGLPATAKTQEKLKWCTHCNTFKPPRTHHCRTCQRCVLKMDHHCMFVNNCVGKRNHMHFFLLIFNIALAVVVLGLCLLPQILTIFGDRKESAFERSIALAAFVIAVVAATIFVPFAWYHLQRILHNETTLEQMRREQLESPKKRAKLKSDGKIFEAVVSYSRSPLENVGDVFGMPPAWSRAALEPALGFLTSRTNAKRNA